MKWYLLIFIILALWLTAVLYSVLEATDCRSLGGQPVRSTAGGVVCLKPESILK